MTGAEYGCGCPLLPVLWFRVAGTWERAEVCRDRLPVIDWAEAQALSASEVYQLCDAAAWVIACPRCRAVYLGATDPPLPPADDVADMIDLGDDAEDQWPPYRPAWYDDQQGATFLT